jgi:hypothetical protein
MERPSKRRRLRPQEECWDNADESNFREEKLGEGLRTSTFNNSDNVNVAYQVAYQEIQGNITIQSVSPYSGLEVLLIITSKLSRSFRPP